MSSETNLPSSLGELAAAASTTSMHDGLHDMFAGPDRVTSRPSPPLDKWHPSHCGDIGMEIRRDGSWWHAGSPIRRQDLVALFASILRLEGDREYYLVTPVEKVRVSVALHPLRIIDAEPLVGRIPETLILTLNTGGQVPLDGRHSLSTEPKAGSAAYVTLDNGLTALFTRAAWYRLAELADESGTITSDGRRFSLA
ncbi:MAG: DUF1285 domain-containing protein [Halieaceae bacterium]